MHKVSLKATSRTKTNGKSNFNIYEKWRYQFRKQSNLQLPKTTVNEKDMVYFGLTLHEKRTCRQLCKYVFLNSYFLTCL